MNRTASIVLFLIAAALTAFLAVQSAHWLPPDPAAWDRFEGSLGACVGLLGGGWGAAVGILASRGRARRLVMVWGLLLWAAGVGMLFGATAHIAAGNPRYVSQPWLQTGAVLSLVFGLMLPVAGRHYRAAEMRRLHARDISST